MQSICRQFLVSLLVGRNLGNAQSAIWLQRVIVQPIRGLVTRTFIVLSVNIFRISKYGGVVHALLFIRLLFTFFNVQLACLVCKVQNKISIIHIILFINVACMLFYFSVSLNNERMEQLWRHVL